MSGVKYAVCSQELNPYGLGQRTYYRKHASGMVVASAVVVADVVVFATLRLFLFYDAVLTTLQRVHQSHARTT
jgi:hypothetical protein